MKNQLFFSGSRPALSSSPLRWIFVFAVINLFLFGAVRGQIKVKATGTGQTTGHIANLTVTNTTSESLQINSQTAYIPSDGRYQSYVGTVPETTVPPGTTIIPVNGNCAIVSSPPFPIGINMIVENWIPVGTIDQPLPEGTINILPMPTKPQFTPDDIPDLIGSPGYTLITDLPKGDSEIIINWPDTNIPMGGVIDPDKYPEDFAPVIVEVLEDIIDAVDIILEDDHFDTPISGNPEKERESVIQQTFWIYMAAATGDEYTRNDFAAKVYDQFLTSSGKPVTSLPEEQKEKVDEGIVDFWNSFHATGIEAKVINKDSPITRTGANVLQLPDEETTPIQHREDPICIANKTYTQEYTRGQNDAHQLTTQANKMLNGKCMYQTAMIGVKWNMLSACDCDKVDPHCKGEIKVHLEVEIKGLVSGDPTDHILVNAPAPTVEKRTKLIHRDTIPGQRKDSLPGPNIQVNIDDQKKLGPGWSKFRKIRRQDIYKATGVTTIPCEAGIYPVRFMIVPQNSHVSIRDRKHDYTSSMTFLFDANITIAQKDCVLAEPVIESFASEFRADWTPADVKYLEKAMLKTINPKDELPQVKVNQDEKTYYSLLKLVNDNGEPKGKVFPAKDGDVKRGIK